MKTINKVFKRIRADIACYVLIAPFMIAFMIFTVIPTIASFYLGLTDFNMLQTPSFVGFQNFRTLFLNDEVFIIAVRNTLIFAAISGPLSYISCYIFAWFINELPGKLRAFMTVIFYVPALVGGMVSIWQYILSSDRYGVLNSFLLQFGFIDAPILWLKNPDYMMVSCLIVSLWSGLGVSFLSFMAGFRTVDTTLYEAGAIDGVKNRFQEVWYITLPQMKPQMLFGAVMQIAGAFATGSIQSTLCGLPSTDYAVHTIMNHISDYGSTRYEMGYACAMSTVLLLVMLLTNKVINKVLKDD